MTAFRFDFYAALRAQASDIVERVARRAEALAIPEDWRGRIGLSGSNSSAPGTLRRPVLDAIVAASSQYLPLVRTGDEIRRVVKSVYGDDYDVATVNSAEAALALTYDTLIAPSLVGRGEPGRAYAIVPYERHIEHHGSYGRPAQAIYKDVFADRGATAGEFGLLGRRAQNVEIGFVRLAGARYEVHGIKQYVTPLLLHVDPHASADALEHAALRRAGDLAGFVSLGYDSPGLGYGDKDADGTSVLHRSIGDLARQFDVPYIADNAWGMPFLGTDPRAIGADVIFYSMDKVAGGPTAGLIVGREAALVNIRRAMGLHGERFGTVSSHGKGSHIFFDPGKEALTGTLAALRLLRDQPALFLDPVEATWAIVQDEFARMAGRLKPGIVLHKSVNLGGVEINYQDTWGEGGFGIPIFSHEDRIAQTNLINNALVRIGIVPNLSDDANILITPGAGTTDADGQVIAERLRLTIRAVFLVLEILQDWSEEFQRGVAGTSPQPSRSPKRASSDIVAGGGPRTSSARPDTLVS